MIKIMSYIKKNATLKRIIIPDRRTLNCLSQCRSKCAKAIVNSHVATERTK